MLAIVLLTNFEILKFCCDIQGLHLISYLWVSLIIDQSECLICYFLCTELTLFCTELPENCIYLNQSELSNFSMYIIKVQSMNICFINFTFHARIKLYFPDYQQDMLRMRCFNEFRLKLLIEKLRERVNKQIKWFFSCISILHRVSSNLQSSDSCNLWILVD